MSSYRFGDRSDISDIVIRKSAGGGVRAFLFARADLSPEAREGIRKALLKEYWQIVPTELGGEPCLEVRGARNIQDLEGALRPDGYLMGSTIQTANGESEPQYSLKERFRSNMLWIYGIMNVVADFGIMGYGHLRKKLPPKPGEEAEAKHWEEAAGAWAYFAGSNTFAFFGRGDKSDHHVRDIAKKLQEKFRQMGITVGEMSHTNGSSALPDQGRGILAGAKEVLDKHTAEIGNTATAIAGAFFAKSAWKNKNYMDGALGLSTFTSGMTAALVKEKAPNPNEPPPATVFGKAWRWVQERPNRIAGGGLLLSTFVHGYEALKNIFTMEKNYNLTSTDPRYYKNPRKMAYIAYGLRFAFAFTNLIDEIILTFASKGIGSGVKTDTSVDETAYALVADAILQRPANERDQLIKEMSASFLADPQVLGGDANTIEAELRKRVENIALHPWRAPKVTPAQIAAEEPAPKASWQDKQAQRSLVPAEAATAIG